MDPLAGKLAWAMALVAMSVLRAPHVRRTMHLPVAREEIGAREVVLLTLVGVGLLVLPLLWILTPWLDAFDWSTTPFVFGAGCGTLGLGLLLLHRSHVDLGNSWSNFLQVREGHRLVTEGIYARVRHPMYLALLLYGLGQALVLPNLVAGPFFLAAFALLVATRLGPEERLMRETFGHAWEAYAARTWRLLPGVW